MTSLRVFAALALWLAFASGAAAQVIVQSGEHDGFTRLALTFDGPVDWQVTRRADGYELTIAEPPQPYDLSRVYQRIARNRLSAISVDAETGALRLDVACACHALPFEYRPGIVVIDLRDGPPPEASAFELATDGTRMAPLALRAPYRPTARPAAGLQPVRAAGDRPGYDWVGLVTGQGLPVPPPAEAIPSAPYQAPGRDTPIGVDMAALRSALFDDLARGAARGAVSLRLPVEAQTGPLAALDQVQIGLADELAAMIGLRQAGAPTGAMTAEGAPCHPDAALDLAAWGDPRPVAQALGPLMADLYGEFDRVNVDSAERAVRYLLSLGFGAEARGMIRTLGLTGDESALWATMGRVLDGETDPQGAFAGMAACDSAAALWSVLGDEVGGTDGPVNTAALMRAFSDLPPSLRRHLGRAVADRMLDRGDTATVRSILQAMERVPGDAGPGVTLVEAGLAAHDGEDPDLAALDRMRQSTGPDGLAATVTLIRAALAKGEAVGPALIAETEARLTEYAGTPEEAPLRQALAEAQASQGNFDRAFALSGAEGPGAAPVWSLLAEKGGLSPLLERAVVAPGAMPPAMPAEVRRALARRLLDAGLAGPAMAWANAAGAALPASIEGPDRLLAAEAELIRRDPAAALRLLAGMTEPGADVLRLRAMTLLEDPAAADLAKALGDGAAAEVLARKAADWANVAQAGPDAWRSAAARALPLPAAAEPPLARSRALLADSAAARADLDALLAATAVNP